MNAAKLMIEWKGTRSGIIVRARPYAISLGNHYKAYAANLPVGPEDRGGRFPDVQTRTNYAQTVYDTVTDTCTQMFTHRGNVRWAATPADITAIPMAANGEAVEPWDPRPILLGATRAILASHDETT